MKGPLLDGEIERATAWGDYLAQQAGASSISKVGSAPLVASDSLEDV
jgi:hypothetical protein